MKAAAKYTARKWSKNYVAAAMLLLWYTKYMVT